MIRALLIPAAVALSACADVPLIPDFRDTGAADASAPVAAAPTEGPVTEVLIPTVQASDKDRLLTAIEANGCVINVSTIGPILSQASINQTQLANLTVELENDGMLAPSGTDTVRLSSANCL